MSTSVFAHRRRHAFSTRKVLEAKWYTSLWIEDNVNQISSLAPTTSAATATQQSFVCMCVCVCLLSIPGIGLRTTVVACDCAPACQSRVLLFRVVSLLGTKGIWSSLLSWSSNYLNVMLAWLCGEKQAEQLEISAELKIYGCQFIVGDHTFPWSKNFTDKNKPTFPDACSLWRSSLRVEGVGKNMKGRPVL